MKARILSIFTISLFCVVLLSGCSNHDGNEWERVVCEVESINFGTPLLSAYLDVGGDKIAGTNDDIFPIDWVPVSFLARTYSSSVIVPENTENSWFHVTNYDINWLPGPSCPEAITDYNVVNGHTEVVVPVNENGVASILIADRVMKEEPWFRSLYEIPGTSFTAACQLTFRGHETGSSRVVTIESGFMVTFYGAVATD